MDLLQAEAVVDLVKAKTELSRRWAVAQLEGILSGRIRAIKATLLDILSHLEASIDFPDDFPDTESFPRLAGRLGEIEKEIVELLSTAAAGVLCKRGIRLVIAGRPNVGKSSIMNRLAKENRVIVSDCPGTTRDVVEEEIQLGGFPFRLMDTAGIQNTSHPVEKEGIERAKRAVADADLVLYVLDGSQEWHPEDGELLGGLQAKKVIVAVNKADLPQRLDRLIIDQCLHRVSRVESSCVTREGIRALEEVILSSITDGGPSDEDGVAVTSQRQRNLLEKALENVQNARRGSLKGLSPELIAVEVRLGLDQLGMVVGEVVTDDLLEVLFNQFCIGK
jgi:tRNA modification GTPase